MLRKGKRCTKAERRIVLSATGATGATGAAGPTGAPGPAGSTGPVGPSEAFTFTGTGKNVTAATVGAPVLWTMTMPPGDYVLAAHVKTAITLGPNDENVIRCELRVATASGTTIPARTWLDVGNDYEPETTMVGSVLGATGQVQLACWRTQVPAPATTLSVFEPVVTAIRVGSVTTGAMT